MSGSLRQDLGENLALASAFCRDFPWMRYPFTARHGCAIPTLKDSSYAPTLNRLNFKNWLSHP